MYTTSMLNILVISGEARKVHALFAAEGYHPEPGRSRKKPSPLSYDLALLDLDDEGWRQRLLDLRQKAPVIAFSKADIHLAVEAMKLGACDYLEKPLTGHALHEAIAPYRKKIPDPSTGFDKLVGKSAPMQEVFGLIKRAAVSESNVLITGESGTGKELVARAIHRWSPRKEGAFMTINCSAIPDTLLESELFGFEKGAFTGANYTKKGLIELAHGGTVFFDEIGDVSPLFQVKILRVLQENEIMRIGGARPVEVDVRIIAATNRNLKAECQRRAFREDLFYRLNVINIHLPPLRERMEDIPLLVEHFIKKHGTKRKDILVKGITDEALDALLAYSYPGNARELENIIERAVSFADGPSIVLSDLPSSLLSSAARKKVAKPLLKDALATVERELIWSALQKSRGNISKAADELGVHRQQLQRKIKQMKIAT